MLTWKDKSLFFRVIDCIESNSAVEPGKKTCPIFFSLFFFLAFGSESGKARVCTEIFDISGFSLGSPRLLEPSESHRVVGLPSPASARISHGPSAFSWSPEEHPSLSGYILRMTWSLDPELLSARQTEEGVGSCNTWSCEAPEVRELGRKEPEFAWWLIMISRNMTQH